MQNDDNIKTAFIGPLLAAGGRALLTNAPRVLSMFNIGKLAEQAYRLKPVRDFITSKWPGLGGGIGPEVFKENFVKAIDNPAFQTIAVTAIQQMAGLGQLPQDLYKPEAFSQLYSTKGYGGEMIAAGAYQKTTGKLPPREILPRLTVNQFEESLRRISKDPSLKTSAQKYQRFLDLIKSAESQIGPFMGWTQQNFPTLF